MSNSGGYSETINRIEPKMKAEFHTSGLLICMISISGGTMQYLFMNKRLEVLENLFHLL